MNIYFLKYCCLVLKGCCLVKKGKGLGFTDIKTRSGNSAPPDRYWVFFRNYGVQFTKSDTHKRLQFTTVTTSVGTIKS